MNGATLNVTASEAAEALKAYRSNRGVWDAKDKEIARIYRQVSLGKVVISVNDSIINAGLDSLGRPRLAIMRADQEFVRCIRHYEHRMVFTNIHNRTAQDFHFEIPWTHGAGNTPGVITWRDLRAALPRIPPHLRPTTGTLSDYHILWEADWEDLPRDPMLLKRLSKDAWVVVASWDLSDVEMNVLRAHQKV